MTIEKNSLQKLDAYTQVAVICGHDVSGAISTLFAKGHSIEDVRGALANAEYILSRIQARLDDVNVKYLKDYTS